MTCTTPYVIAQKYSSVTFVSPCFYSSKKKFGAPFKNIYFFNFLNCAILKPQLKIAQVRECLYPIATNGKMLAFTNIYGKTSQNIYLKAKRNL
jgi:hypothetical protein